MRVGSLFAGIGGFDLAAEWMGWETAWFSELARYPAAVLEHRWPGVPNLGDITNIDFSKVEPIDLLCGGFPCQDISTAGKRIGIRGERSGLWNHYGRAIRELRPRYIVVENVAALLTPGRGMHVVLGDLAALGYDAEWEVLSAADVGAPHLRERVWLVCYPSESGTPSILSDSIRDTLWQLRERQWQQHAESREAQPRADGEGQPLADAPRIRDGRSRQRAEPDGPAGGGADGFGASEAEDEPLADPKRRRRHQGAKQTGRPAGPEANRLLPRADAEMADADGGRCEQRDSGKRGLLQPHARGPAVSDADGFGCQRESRSQAQGGERQTIPTNGCLVDWWLTEPNVGRVAHGVTARVDRLTALGNAIVPLCAFVIFQAVQAREEVLRSGT